jgi:hypothetical protein
MNTTANDLDQLRELNKRFIHNFVTNDVASHSAILHPDFRSISSTGKRVARDAYLDYWATGFDPDVIVYWDMRDEQITVHDNTALVSATNRWVRLSGQRETVGMTSYTDTYVRIDGVWRCVLAQLTPVAAENFPSDSTVVVRYLCGQRQALPAPGAP